MIDVMLVLLIIFMAVGPLVAAGFPATLPRGVHLTSHPDETEDAVVGLDVHGRYYLNNVPVSEAELSTRLTAAGTRVVGLVSELPAAAGRTHLAAP
jgi:biopolymer transport protein ExbD